jgi:hypothetical protein
MPDSMLCKNITNNALVSGLGHCFQRIFVQLKRNKTRYMSIIRANRLNISKFTTYCGEETEVVMINVAINGFGRIGRNILRALYERPDVASRMRVVAY